jgi:hypothetical protein
MNICICDAPVLEDSNRCLTCSGDASFIHDFDSLDDVRPPTFVRCPCCHGSGNHEHEDFDRVYTVHCQTCRGAGLLVPPFSLDSSEHYDDEPRCLFLDVPMGPNICPFEPSHSGTCS